jgi:DNA-binding GntR family transcriptional regulator
LGNQDKPPKQGLIVRPAPEFNRRMPLADQVYDDLNQRILSLELPPNLSLSRTELSKFYGISQTPLRDALLRLETDHLLRIYPQSRTVVSPINVNDVRETQFLRNAVEKDIVGLLSSESQGSSLLPAEDSIMRMDRIASQQEVDFEAFDREDKIFHASLFQAAGKTGLFEMIEARSGNLNRIRRLHLSFREDAKPARVVEDHRSILVAIAEGDAGKARAAMRSHLSHTLDRLEELRLRFPDLFD